MVSMTIGHLNLAIGTNNLLDSTSRKARGCSSMVELQLPKLTARVRFPSPAPKDSHPNMHVAGSLILFFFTSFGAFSSTITMMFSPETT